MSAPEECVLVGIGNPYRRDDGIGPALVAAVGRLGVPGVTLTCADGEPSRLLDAWDGAVLTVVVYAVACAPAAPGRIHRTEVTAPYALDGDPLAGGPLAAAAAGVRAPTGWASRTPSGWPSLWTVPPGGWLSWPWRPPTWVSAPACLARSPPACRS